MMALLSFFRDLWGSIVRPRLAALLDEVFEDLAESEIFEMAVEWGRVASRQMLDSTASDESKRRMIEDQIRSEAQRMGHNLRTHVVEMARVMAYRSILKEKGEATIEKNPSLEPKPDAPPAEQPAPPSEPEPGN